MEPLSFVLMPVLGESIWCSSPKSGHLRTASTAFKHSVLNFLIVIVEFSTTYTINMDIITEDIDSNNIANCLSSKVEVLSLPELSSFSATSHILHSADPSGSHDNCNSISPTSLAFESINLSTLKIPIVNISLPSSVVFETSPMTLLPNVAGANFGNCSLFQEPYTSLKQNNNAIRDNLNRYHLIPKNARFSTTSYNGELHQQNHQYVSERCVKIRPLVKPNFITCGSVASVELLESDVKVFDMENNITISQSHLDTVDSRVDNAVIVVDNIDPCATVQDHHFDSSLNRELEITSNASGVENQWHNKSFNELNPKNESKLFTSSLNPCIEFVTNSLDDSELNDDKCLVPDLMSLDNSSRCGDSDGDTVPVYPHFLCLVCGKSELLCKQQNAKTTVIEKPGITIMRVLVERIHLDQNEINQRSDKICVICIKKINEIEDLRETLNFKQDEIIQDFKTSSGWVHELGSAIDIEQDIQLQVNVEDKLFNEEKKVRLQPLGGLSLSNLVHMKHNNNCQETGRGLQFRCLQCHVGFPEQCLRDEHSLACSLGPLRDLMNKRSPDVWPMIKSKRKHKRSNIKRRQNGSEYYCKKCHEFFSSRAELAGHISTHSSNFDCAECGRFLTSKARLKAHIFKFHGIGEGKQKDIACDMCSKTFQTKAGLSYHQNVAHQTKCKYICEHCDKVYYHHAPYRSHLLFAHGKKKIVCETCGEMFFTVSKLNTHINAVHRLAQSWHCVKCSLKFTTGTSFRHHNLVKHHNKKYGCSFCSVQFRKKVTLLAHLREHAIYKCHLCNDNFLQEDLYNCHLLEAHKHTISKQLKHEELSSDITTLKRPKMRLDSKKLFYVPKSAAKIVEPISSLSRVNLNDILLSNSYSNSGNLPVFSEADKMTSNFGLSDSTGKIQSFCLLESGAELQVSDNSLSIDDGVPFIDVEILNDIKLNEGEECSVQDQSGSVVKLTAINMANEHAIKTDATIKCQDSSSVHVQLCDNINSIGTGLQPSFGPITNSTIAGLSRTVVTDLLNPALQVQTGAMEEQLANSHHLNISTVAHDLHSRADAIHLPLKTFSHVCNPLNHESPEMESSVHHLGSSVDIESSVVDLNSSMSLSVHHLNGDRTIEPSQIWLKENSWALLKETSTDENLEQLPSSGIDDLDMSVIESAIVGDNVITQSETLHLGISISEKSGPSDLDDFGASMSS